MPVSVLFVCLGNICRSPLAEGIFAHLVSEASLNNHISIDSCGTSGHHNGELPDPRSRAVASRHGITLPGRSRQLEISDFENFDWIIPMDQSNYDNIMKLMPEGSASSIRLMRSWDPMPQDRNVPDPYWSGEDGFQLVYDMLLRSCEAFLVEVVKDVD